MSCKHVLRRRGPVCQDLLATFDGSSSDEVDVGSYPADVRVAVNDEVFRQVVLSDVFTAHPGAVDGIAAWLRLVMVAKHEVSCLGPHTVCSQHDMCYNTLSIRHDARLFVILEVLVAHLLRQPDVHALCHGMVMVVDDLVHLPSMTIVFWEVLSSLAPASLPRYCFLCGAFTRNDSSLRYCPYTWELCGLSPC